MKRPWLIKAPFYILCIVILLFIGWKFILPSHKASSEPIQVLKIEAENKLFEAFSNYEGALSDQQQINQKIDKASESEKPGLNQKIAALENKVAKSSKELDDALSKLQSYYPHEKLVKERIQSFQEWKKQSEKQILVSSSDNWHLPFLHLQMGIIKAIDKEETNTAETSHEEDPKAEDEKIMAAVPGAEEELKKHPNDKKLCTVMQQVLARNPELTVQQIAFFNVGDQYCPRYYADPIAWGEWGIKAHLVTPQSIPGRSSYSTAKINEQTSDKEKEEVELNKKYGALPYSQYYSEYVLPRIPRAIEILKNPKQNKEMCLTDSWSVGPRNPEQDAARAAYVQAGKQYCPSATSQQAYNGTGVMCLSFCDALCREGMACDCVERCKKTPGILFNYDPQRIKLISAGF